MHYLLEDPWPATYVCGGAAAVCFALLRITQQGKYLIAGGIAWGLVGLAWGLDALWVTETERVEETVYGLARAVRDAHPAPAADDETSPGQGPDRARIDRAMDFLTPDATYERGGHTTHALMTQGLLRNLLATTTFDSLNVTRLEVNVAEQSRRATARFRVYASGTAEQGTYRMNFMTDAQGTEWELGLKETSPGVWKVTRITPLRLPGEARHLGLPTGL